MFFVYILRCADGSLYIGSTQDVYERLKVHLAGRGPTFTAKRLPVELVYRESFATLEEAVQRERQLKGWTRAKKEALIASDKAALQNLSIAHSSGRLKRPNTAQRN